MTRAPALGRPGKGSVMEANGVRTLVTGRGLVESPRWQVTGCTSPTGRRVRCSRWTSPDGRLLRREPDGSLVTHAGLGRPGWNDIVVDGRGNAYVNRAGFNPMAGEEFRPGSVYLVAADGAVHQVAGDIAFPNGMAVTGDDSTLIVADSYRHQLVGFDIGADGGLSGRRVWADLGEGVPDGICADAQDAVWYADVPNQRCVRVAAGGAVLQTVDLDRGGFACMLGGPERTTLFIVAAQWRGMSEAELVTPGSGQVLSADVQVPRAGSP